jgi:cytosine/uracil/thiamine/allantoin permease
MNPSKRVLIVGIFFELCLAALWAYLLFELRTGGLHASTTTEEAVSTIGSTLGGVMGALGGVLIVVYFVLRKKERGQ